ncbi:MAG: hypothetical protein GXO39_08015 [Thermotogae bacterium]|nr:hypothetical protein [Thermotogota bacterium]
MYDKYLKTRGIFFGVLFFAILGMWVMSFLVRKIYMRQVLLVPSIEEASQLQSPTTMFFQLSRGLMATPVQIFIDLASSDAFKREFVREYNLSSILKTENPDKQVKLLESKIEMEVLPSASIVIRGYDPDSTTASKLVLWYVSFLNRKANEALNVKGREMRRFLERRLAAVEKEIKILQDSIESLERESHILAVAPEEILGPALSSLLEMAAKKETEYIILRGMFSEDVPDVVRARQEAEILRKEIDRQFQTLPRAIRRASRYRMELEIKSKVYATLYEEYEKAKLMELKNNPMLQPVFAPSGPVKRVWPKRVIPTITIVIGLTFAFALMLTLFTAFDRLRETTIGKILESLRGDVLP